MIMLLYIIIITMNTNVYFTHYISESIKIPPNAPSKSKQFKDMLSKYLYTSDDNKPGVVKKLNFEDIEQEVKPFWFAY
jgi:hypothetical protein